MITRVEYQCGTLCTKLLRCHLINALEQIPKNQQVPSSPPPKTNNQVYYHKDTLYLLWRFLAFLDSHYGLKNLLDILECDINCNSGELRMLQQFCDSMSHYITILDDIEMYEQQKPFVMRDYILMSSFLNILHYKGISRMFRIWLNFSENLT
ncbi:ubiquitin-protein ligase E3B [Aphis craccivora]|uniref:Ubiquitin-protein ligase E3B n=1 Tax=Aphis craccivora TaxID=307492 RepID=A0A6G0Z0R1_APHCR|nr:ubiquitin-protein ligase E3B [Aphis craccivora]